MMGVKTTTAKILVIDAAIIVINGLLMLAWTLAQDHGFKQLGNILGSITMSHTNGDFGILNIPFIIMVYYVYHAFRKGFGDNLKSTAKNIFLAVLNFVVLNVICYIVGFIFIAVSLLMTGGRLG
jgi:hypothetical protein